MHRVDKARREHKGQRGRKVIWYLVLPPFTSYTHTHTSTHPCSLCTPNPPLPASPDKDILFSILPFFLLSDGWQKEERGVWATDLRHISRGTLSILKFAFSQGSKNWKHWKLVMCCFQYEFFFLFWKCLFIHKNHLGFTVLYLDSGYCWNDESINNNNC